MATSKVYVPVGYGHPVMEVGVSRDVITERKLYGEIKRNSRQLHEGGNLNKDLVVQNSISVMADAYALDHFFAIRYVVWAGVCWTVDDVTVEPPRLLLRLGGVYNGPRPETSPTPAPGDP